MSEFQGLCETPAFGARSGGVALATLPRPVQFDAGIHRVVPVPSGAVRFGRVTGGDRLAPKRVHAASNGLEVLRSDAVVDSAQVVEWQLVRDRAVSEGVAPTVSKGGNASLTGPEDTVARPVRASGPQPAGVGLVDLRPEPLSGWAEGSSTRETTGALGRACPPLVMHRAQGAAVARVSTTINRTSTIGHVSLSFRLATPPDGSRRRGGFFMRSYRLGNASGHNTEGGQ
jgi:hypothetical protein